MHNLIASEYHPYYDRYIKLVPEGNILNILEYQIVTLLEIFNTLNDEKALYRYAENKWSIKELLGHLIDTERMFLYRALCICRNDKTDLPGFDQNSYVQNANFDDQLLKNLLEQFEITRTGLLKLYKSLPPVKWSTTGTANGKKLSVGAIAFIMAGHVYHNLGILKEHYLKN